VPVVVEQHDMNFGEFLRSLRAFARLTQEELAQASGVSQRAISDLERGVNLTARKDTARLLADALNLSGPARAEFESAARGDSAQTATILEAPQVHEHLVAHTTPRLPHDPRHFTGRESELAKLMDAVTDGGVVGIYAIDGMAGVGKSAFAVHAAHVLAARFPDGQIYLPLRAHAAGQPPVDPVDALASLLLATDVPAQQIPAGLAERSALWREHMSGRRMLLLLDDAAGHEQVRPLLPDGSESFVLVTSRRHLSALDDVTSICLNTFLPDDAVAMLIRVAGRADLDADDPAALRVAQMCGYLPLAIGMMARHLHHHPAWTLGGLAGDLAEARDRLELMHAENLSVAAAFDLSYQDLTSRQQRLFRRLGLNPGADIAAHAAAALDDTSPAAARRGLDELFDQHLVIEPDCGRYRMHDLIRERAAVLASADDPRDRELSIGRLLDYYASAATAADRHFSRAIARVGGSWTGLPQAGRRAVDRLFDHAGLGVLSGPELIDYRTALAWLDTESSNLLACADYAAAHGDGRRLIRLAGALSAYLAHAGLWDRAMNVHAAACAAAESSGDWLGHANSLANLGWVKYLTGDSAGADQALDEARGLYHAMGEVLDEADVLVNIGKVRWLVGDFHSATEVLEEARRLYRGSGDRLGQADSLRILGKVRRETARYDAATASLDGALSIYRQFSDSRREADAMTDLGGTKRLTGKFAEARSLLEAALTLYQAIGDRRGEATALVQLGAVYEQTGEYEKALSLSEAALTIVQSIGGPYGEADTLLRIGVALRRMGDSQESIRITLDGLHIFRNIGSRIGQADALCDLGAALGTNGEHEEASKILREALALYTSVNNRHGEAETLNQLGQVQLAAGNTDAASECHARALAASRAIGIPVEEGRSLEGLARCQLRSGESAAALAGFREALTIFRRIGAAEATSVTAELAKLTGRSITR
jgi:tetratricopeptide (TPR) repeat protein/transcriptional regulator with XRE-family HTH domain